MDAAAQVARLVQRIERERMLGGAAWLLNVNVPNRPVEELKPIKVCRLGRRHAAEKVITQDSPRGDTMYWIAGAGGAADSGEGTDFHATAAGHVALTPLQIDLTDHARLGEWARPWPASTRPTERAGPAAPLVPGRAHAHRVGRHAAASRSRWPPGGQQHAADGVRSYPCAHGPEAGPAGHR